MQMSVKDKQALRRLAECYSEIAHLDVQKERMERYTRTNALENVRPVVLIDEVPWGEIKDSALTNVCAAENIGRDYVMAAKPNPAFVATARFDPAPVEAEIARYCKACRDQGTTLEFVLKDISTIANNPESLTQWAATVSATIDQYYS